jgi:hypothetical protein
MGTGLTGLAWLSASLETVMSYRVSGGWEPVTKLVSSRAKPLMMPQVARVALKKASPRLHDYVASGADMNCPEPVGPCFLYVGDPSGGKAF